MAVHSYLERQMLGSGRKILALLLACRKIARGVRTIRANRVVEVTRPLEVSEGVWRATANLHLAESQSVGFGH